MSCTASRDINVNIRLILPGFILAGFFFAFLAWVASISPLLQAIDLDLALLGHFLPGHGGCLTPLRAEF